MLCRKISVINGRGSVPVYLNVYDLTPINCYAYWLGLGVYHSGLQVHGVEYAYGGHEYPSTGIFEGDPKQLDGFTFRESILMGWTELSPLEVRAMMEEELAQKYKGNAYNLITKNCNHFCSDACIILTGNRIPSWVNRLARIGLFCNCIVPASVTSNKVRHHRIEDKVCEGEVKKLNSLLAGPNSPCSPVTTNKRSRSRGRNSSPLVLLDSSAN